MAVPECPKSGELTWDHGRYRCAAIEQGSQGPDQLERPAAQIGEGVLPRAARGSPAGGNVRFRADPNLRGIAPII
jgi:hypothetical protein